MKLNLEGKYALVCGGSKGIGLASAIELSRLGCNVTMAARHVETLGEGLRQLDKSRGQVHRFICFDMSDPAGVNKRLVNIQPGFHILVLNSGGPKSGPLTESLLSDLQSAFNSLLLSSQVIVQHSLKTMKEDGYGRVINITSIGLKEPISGLGVSNTMRGAVGSWAKTLAGELGPFGITVNNILPGYTLTDRLDTLMEQRANAQGISKAQIIDKYLEHIPARRLAEPSEIGTVVAFLASPAAAYINGVNLPVDGGFLHCL